MSGFSFQPSTAPGREGPAPAPAPQTAQPTPAPGDAPPAGAAGQSPFGGASILLFLAPLLLLFLMTRNQNKKQKEIESNIKVGDRVITRSGLVGKVVSAGDRLKVEIAPGVNVEMVRSAVEGLDAPKAEAGKADDKADKKDDKADKKDDKKDDKAKG